MSEDERSPRPQRPDLSSDAALDRLLWRLGPLMQWQDHEETSAPEEESARPDPAFARRLRARLTEEEEEATPPRDRRGVDRRVALRVGLAAAALAVVIVVAVAVVEVGVVAALTTALALVALAAVLIVRARLGQ